MSRRGFTLIEVLIVVLILMLLALIVIPRIVGAVRKGNEAALRGDLHELRNAIQQFNSDIGDWPTGLEQLVAPASVPPAGLGGSGLTLDSNNYKGPYLRNPDQGLPKDPFTRDVDWEYNPQTGEIHSSSNDVSPSGIPYSNW